jgi:hypothetical protein
LRNRGRHTIRRGNTETYTLSPSAPGINQNLHHPAHHCTCPHRFNPLLSSVRRDIRLAQFLFHQSHHLLQIFLLAPVSPVVELIPHGIDPWGWSFGFAFTIVHGRDRWAECNGCGGGIEGWDHRSKMSRISTMLHQGTKKALKGEGESLLLRENFRHARVMIQSMMYVCLYSTKTCNPPSPLRSPSPPSAWISADFQ